MLGSLESAPSRPPRRWMFAAIVAALAVVAPDLTASAAPGDEPPTTSTTTAPPTTTTTAPPTTTVPPTTAPPATVPPTTAPPATVPPATVPPTTVPPTTVPSRPPTAERRRAAAAAPSAAAAPGPCRVATTLARRMRSAAVLCLEQHLVRVGHLTSPDNYFDVTTAAAVRAYQQQVRLRVTGIAGPATLARLGIWSGPSFTLPCTVASPVRPGARNGYARCVEQRLVALGFILTGPDRRFDGTAVAAVRAYQRQVRLLVTGIAGPATLAKLGIWSGPSITVRCTVSRPVIHHTGGTVARCVEQRLIQLGYDLRGPDRSFDSSAVAALRAYQGRRGLPADGMAGKVTLRALRIWKEPRAVRCKVSVTVRLGTSGRNALCTERKLVKAGFAFQGPDRTFDVTAVNALRAFQRAHGLSADGVAGPVTLSRLGIWKAPDPTLLPRKSGSGRRIVYLRSAQRIWAVDSNGVVLKTHLVSGRLYEPYAGTYHVYSRSLYSYSTANPSIRWRYMVRFAYGPRGGRIGFHEIPRRNGVPLQSESQLGQPLSGGCVRQATPDAEWIWNWAGLGTKVVVL